MPTPRTIDLSPTPRTEATHFERTLQGAMQGYEKAKTERQDIDAIKQIYGDRRNLDDALYRAQTQPGISPSARVSTVNQLLEMKKINAHLEEAHIKQNAAIKKQTEKDKAEEVEDVAEVEFLDEIADQELKGSEIYHRARAKGISRIRAKEIANMHRMESTQDRLSLSAITSEYDRELRSIDKRIKDARSEEDKVPLQVERDNIKDMRKRDVAKHNKGQKVKELELFADEEASLTDQLNQGEPINPSNVIAPQKNVDPIVAELTETFPPEQFTGKSKWDEDGNEYKSDGKSWKRVK
jgi:hypothetical protein